MADPQDEKTWQLYSEAAASLTRFLRHVPQQKKEAHASGYSAGYKAALEDVLQFTVQKCSTESSNTLDAASLVNFLLMQRENRSDDPSRQAGPAPFAAEADGMAPPPTADTQQHSTAQAPAPASSFVLATSQARKRASDHMATDASLVSQHAQSFQRQPLDDLPAEWPDVCMKRARF